MQEYANLVCPHDIVTSGSADGGLVRVRYYALMCCEEARAHLCASITQLEGSAQSRRVTDAPSLKHRKIVEAAGLQLGHELLGTSVTGLPAHG